MFLFIIIFISFIIDYYHSKKMNHFERDRKKTGTIGRKDSTLPISILNRNNVTRNFFFSFEIDIICIPSPPLHFFHFFFFFFFYFLSFFSSFRLSFFLLKNSLFLFLSFIYKKYNIFSFISLRQKKTRKT